MMFDEDSLRLLALTVDPAEATACLPRQVRTWKAALTKEEFLRAAYQYYAVRKGNYQGPQNSNVRRLDAGLSRVCKEYAARFGPLPEGIPTDDLFISARQAWKKPRDESWKILQARIAELPNREDFSLWVLYESCFSVATSREDIAQSTAKKFTQYGNALRTILGSTHQQAWRILLEDICNLDGVSLYAR